MPVLHLQNVLTTLLLGGILPFNAKPYTIMHIGSSRWSLEVTAHEIVCKSERKANSTTSLRLPSDELAGARWRCTQTSSRSARGIDRQFNGLRSMERHHASGSQRVHMLGRRCQTTTDPTTPHSPNARGARSRSTATVLLAWVQTPRAHR